MHSPAEETGPCPASRGTIEFQPSRFTRHSFYTTIWRFGTAAAGHVRLLLLFSFFFFTLIVIARTNGGVRAGGFFSPVIYEPLLPTLAAASIAGQSQRFTCSFLPFVFDSFLPIPPARFPTIYFDDSPFVFISFAFWPFVFFFVDGHLFYSSPRVLIQFDPHSLQHR